MGGGWAQQAWLGELILWLVEESAQCRLWCKLQAAPTLVVPLLWVNQVADLACLTPLLCSGRSPLACKLPLVLGTLRLPAPGCCPAAA